MKQALTVILLSVSLISIALAQEPAPPQMSPVIKGKANITVGGTTITLSEVHAKKLERIRRMGVTVFYPTFVPGRFSLASVTLTEAEGNWAYHVRFCDKHHLCFSVESADDGVGDGPDGDRKLKGKSRSFGPFTIDVFNPGSEGNSGRRIYYLSDWLKPDKKRVRTREIGLYHFLGEGVTDKEAVSIVESLMPVK